MINTLTTGNSRFSRFISAKLLTIVLSQLYFRPIKIHTNSTFFSVIAKFFQLKMIQLNNALGLFTFLCLLLVSLSKTYFKANGTLTDVMDGSVTVISKREEESLEINGVVYSIIGLVATSVLFIILYLCIHTYQKNAKCKNGLFLTYSYDLCFRQHLLCGHSRIVCCAQILSEFICYASGLKNKTQALQDSIKYVSNYVVSGFSLKQKPAVYEFVYFQCNLYQSY